MIWMGGASESLGIAIVAGEGVPAGRSEASMGDRHLAVEFRRELPLVERPWSGVGHCGILSKDTTGTCP